MRILHDSTEKKLFFSQTNVNKFEEFLNNRVSFWSFFLLLRVHDDDEASWYQFNAPLTMWFFFLFFLFHFIYVFKDKLKSENSKVLDNWPSLIEKLQSERDLARENAEYLSTLQEYFVVSIIETNFSFLFISFGEIVNSQWINSSFKCLLINRNLFDQ